MSKRHRDQNNKMATRKNHRHSNDAVTITYYVESPVIRSPYPKIRPHTFSRNPQRRSKCCYNRRAELLAYANHLRLREADTETVHCLRKCKSSKPKKWKWSAMPARIRTVFCRTFRGVRGRWKYERMVSEEKINSRKKMNSARRSTSQFCRKLKSMLKELSFGGKCSKM